MLDSLVRVSRRVLRVPKAVASPTGIGPPRANARGTFVGRSEVIRSYTNSGPGPVTALGPLASVYHGARLRRPRRKKRARSPRERGERRELRPNTMRVPPGSRPGDRGFDACRFTERRVSHRTRAVDRHPAGRDVLLGEKCTTTNAGHRRTAACPRWTGREDPRGTSPTDAKPASLTMNLPVRSFGFLRFTPERFHVLLNSLFKVLFNFPSRYLFAIGLVVVFSLRWSLPPT